MQLNIGGPPDDPQILAPTEWTMEVLKQGNMYTAEVKRSMLTMCRLRGVTPKFGLVAGCGRNATLNIVSLSGRSPCVTCGVWWLARPLRVTSVLEGVSPHPTGHETLTPS